MKKESPKPKSQPAKAAAPKPQRRMEDILIALCAEAGVGKSIDPVQAAKVAGEARGGDDLAWRSLLNEVRQTAIGMARQGKLVIFRKGKPADPDDFRGVYRIGLPRSE